MGAFEYVVLDEKGRERKGVAEGDTARQVRQNLREKGLIPLQISAASAKRSEESGKGTLSTSRLFQRGISTTELALITRQLATLVQAALPLDEVLTAVANQSEKQRIRSMMYAVRAKVMEGHTLAAGLGEFPKVFSDLYRATVDAGEKSGHLDTVLERLADYTESQQELQGKVRQALIYPAFLSVFAIAIVIFLMTNIVPQVVSVFEDIGQELPGLTRTLIAISDFVIAYGIYLLIAVIALIVGIRALLKQPRFLERYHRWLLNIPIIQKLVRGLNTALFTRTFSILTGSGVTVLESMRISAQVVVNLPMRHAILQATERVREGSGIKTSLDQSKLFPPMMIHLVSSGEAGGRLEEMLGRAAAGQEREVDGLIATLLGILQPLLIVAMGAVVLLIVLAILLPIFDINSLIR